MKLIQIFCFKTAVRMSAILITNQCFSKVCIVSESLVKNYTISKLPDKNDYVIEQLLVNMTNIH